jgi:hypothetical protein
MKNMLPMHKLFENMRDKIIEQNTQNSISADASALPPA